MKFEVQDIEVEAAGEHWNVAFTRDVDSDGSDLGISHVTVFTEVAGEVPLANLGERLHNAIATAIDQWCVKHPMQRWEVQGDGPYFDR